MPVTIFEVEPNGTITAANATPTTQGPSASVRVIGAIGDTTTPTDTDFYKISAAAGQIITVRTTALSNFDGEIQLYTSAGTPVPGGFNDDFDVAANAQNPAGDSFFRFTVATSGDYYLQFRHYLTTQADPFNANTTTVAPITNAPAGYQIFISTDRFVYTPTAAADNINGDADNNLLVGGAGTDTINGNLGDDVIQGGTGADSLVGGAGDDFFQYRAGDGADTGVDGQAGTDIYQIVMAAAGGAGNAVTITGNPAGTITSTVSGAATTLSNIEFLGLQGNENNDTVTLNNVAGTTLTSSFVTPGFIFSGGRGNDNFNGSTNTTPIVVAGDDGNDSMTGGSGTDLLIGGLGTDQLAGGAGDDVLEGGGGADGMAGGAGNDIYFVDNLSDGVNELAGGGTDTILSTISFNLATNTTGNVETLVYIGTASPTLTGSDSADSILGNQTATTADTINGGGGADFMAGFAGNDILVGGLGNDYMLGGTGADAFQFGASFGFDVIGDFIVGQDIVQFAGFATRQDVLNSSLAVDADGDGAVDDTLIFQDGANAVVLVNVLKASLTAAEVGTL